MFKHLSIGEATLALGVCVETLRRWDREGKLSPSYRTPGGHRRYCTNILKGFVNGRSSENERFCVCYSRVSSFDQKEDLVRQEEKLRDHVDSMGLPSVKYISDLGSGMNYKKKGLRNLLHHVLEGKVDRIFITHRDRLLRFGSDLIVQIASEFGTEVCMIDEEESLSDEIVLAQDVLEIITVFSSRMYGKRSHKNRRKKQAA